MLQFQLKHALILITVCSVFFAYTRSAVLSLVCVAFAGMLWIADIRLPPDHPNARVHSVLLRLGGAVCGTLGVLVIAFFLKLFGIVAFLNVPWDMWLLTGATIGLLFGIARPRAAVAILEFCFWWG